MSERIKVNDDLYVGTTQPNAEDLANIVRDVSERSSTYGARATESTIAAPAQKVAARFAPKPLSAGWVA